MAPLHAFVHAAAMSSLTPLTHTANLTTHTEIQCKHCTLALVASLRADFYLALVISAET